MEKKNFLTTLHVIMVCTMLFAFFPHASSASSTHAAFQNVQDTFPKVSLRDPSACLLKMKADGDLTKLPHPISHYSQARFTSLRNFYIYIYYNLAHQLVRLFQFSIYLYEQKITRGFCAFAQTQLLLVNIIGGSVIGRGGALHSWNPLRARTDLFGKKPTELGMIQHVITPRKFMPNGAF